MGKYADYGQQADDEIAALTVANIALEADVDYISTVYKELQEKYDALTKPSEFQWPNATNTGPRIPLTKSPSITTTQNGQIISGLEVQTRIRIRHSDVIVRDCRVLADGQDGVYPIHVQALNGIAPTNVLIEYVEIAGQPGMSLGPPAIYSANGNWTARYCNIHNVGSGPRLANNCTIEYSWMHDTATTNPTEHKSGIGLNGGAHNVIRGNVIECSAAGCSAALALYGSYAPVDDILVEGNRFNTTGSYGVYGGSVSSKQYPHGTNIRFINNRFGRKFNPDCGMYGPIASWEVNGVGNQWIGNVWDDTGALIP